MKDPRGNISDWDAVYEDIGEGFLDEVFGVDSKLDRPVWEKSVLKNCAWVFDSTKLREHVFKHEAFQ